MQCAQWNSALWPKRLQHLRPASVAAEGDADTRALAQRVRRHDAHQQQRLARAGSLQALEPHVLELVQPLLAGPDE